MPRNAVKNGETLTTDKFRYQVFFNVTGKIQEKFEKAKMINV